MLQKNNLLMFVIMMNLFLIIFNYYTEYIYLNLNILLGTLNYIFKVLTEHQNYLKKKNKKN